MVMETERLILREYTDGDFSALFALLSDPVTMQHYPQPYNEAGTRRWIQWNLDNYKTYGFGLWALVLKENGMFIGDCGLTMQNIDGEVLPEVGYHIHKDYWRQGYGKEAARAVRNWAFENRGFDRIFSYMTAANIPSSATAASMGMAKIKEYRDPEGILHFVYTISREQWRRLKE